MQRSLTLLLIIALTGCGAGHAPPTPPEPGPTAPTRDAPLDELSQSYFSAALAMLAARDVTLSEDGFFAADDVDRMLAAGDAIAAGIPTAQGLARGFALDQPTQRGLQESHEDLRRAIEAIRSDGPAEQIHGMLILELDGRMSAAVGALRTALGAAMERRRGVETPAFDQCLWIRLQSFDALSWQATRVTSNLGELEASIQQSTARLDTLRRTMTLLADPNSPPDSLAALERELSELPALPEGDVHELTADVREVIEECQNR